MKSGVLKIASVPAMIVKLLHFQKKYNKMVRRSITRRCSIHSVVVVNLGDYYISTYRFFLDILVYIMSKSVK